MLAETQGFIETLQRLEIAREKLKNTILMVKATIVHVSFIRKKAVVLKFHSSGHQWVGPLFEKRNKAQRLLEHEKLIKWNKDKLPYGYEETSPALSSGLFIWGSKETREKALFDE